MRACYSISSLTIALSTTIMTDTAHSLSTKTVSTVFPEAKHFVSKEHARFEFSSAHPPVIKVDPGDLVHVETNDCFYGKVQPDSLSKWEKEHCDSHDHLKNGTNESRGGTYVDGSILDELPRTQRNPVTGPIYVNGAQPGDVLAVTFLDIRPKGIGVACCGSWGGQLSCWMTKNSATLRFFDMSQCGSIVTMRDPNEDKSSSNAANTANDNGTTTSVRPGSMPPLQQPPPKRLGPIAFPASPMLGVVGVAPSPHEEDPIGTIPAGKHGGNLDNRANGIGSTIYLPIHHPGGLLSMGDMHASQGDGEISGSGVEIGGDVLLTCRVLKHEELYGKLATDCTTTSKGGYPWKLEYPVTETPTHWITHGVVVCDIPQTTSIACQEAAKILIGQWGFSPEEAFLFLSVQGDLGLCQACHPDQGTQIAKMSVPRLEGLCPRAFKVLLSSSSLKMGES